MITEYVSVYSNWDSSSCVRSKPKYEFCDTEFLGRYFSASSLAILDHSLLQGLSEDLINRLLFHKLVSYSRFTDRLERDVVLPACYSLVDIVSNYDLPCAISADAMKTATDEAYHAQFSRQLVNEVCRVSGEKTLPYFSTSFIDFVDDLCNSVSGELKGLVRVFSAFVSETMITYNLSKIPKDKSVNNFVRGVLKDHAEDEGKHHIFFSRIFPLLWKSISIENKNFIGNLLPQLIHKYLSIDVYEEELWLKSVGFTPKETEVCLLETYGAGEAVGDLNSTKKTMNYIEKAGVLDTTSIRNSFFIKGLLN